MTSDDDSDWKLKLRYGKTSTPFQHATLLAVGYMDQARHDYGVDQGPAVMAAKIWSISDLDAVEIVAQVGRDIGFRITGNIEIYRTDPEEPPIDKPSVYGVNFTPFSEE